MIAPFQLPRAEGMTRQSGFEIVRRAENCLRLKTEALANARLEPFLQLREIGLVAIEDGIAAL